MSPAHTASSQAGASPPPDDRDQEDRSGNREPEHDHPVQPTSRRPDRCHREEVRGQAGTERQPIDELQLAPLGGGLDAELHPDRGRRDAGKDQQVTLCPTPSQI